MKSKYVLLTIVLFGSSILLGYLSLNSNQDQTIVDKEDQIRQKINRDRVIRSTSRGPTKSHQNVSSPGRSAQVLRQQSQIQRQPQLLNTPRVKQQVVSNPSQVRQQNIQNNSTRQRLQQFVKNTPAAQNIRSGGHGQQRFGNFDQNRLNRVRTTLPNRINNQNETARTIRQNIGYGGQNRDRWFNRRFWNRHNYRPNYGYGNWWGYSTWPVVNNWLSWDTGTPYYYDSGYPIIVNQETPYLQLDVNTYTSDNDNTVYQDEDQEPQSSDWLPLGVFALVNDATKVSEANMYFQLVLGKDGTISGSYYNNSTDQIYPIEGIVDQDTQQAVWKMAVGEGTPIFQTGIYNLTRGYTNVQVNFNENLSQDWLMIRL